MQDPKQGRPPQLKSQSDLKLQRVKQQLQNLKDAVAELEAELLSNPKQYQSEQFYDEVVKFYQSDYDDDGYPD